MAFRIVVCLVLGYLFGCIQTGYFYGRLHGVDIREHGSGNVGTTNTMRVFGKRAGYMTYAGDALKAIIPVLLVRYLIFPGLDETQLLGMYAGFGVVLGHNFPFYLKFKGGKGIAVTSGVMAAVDLRFIPLMLIGFFAAFYLTGYVSVGSLVLAVLFPVLIFIFYPGHWHMFFLSLAFCLMAFWRHKENIKRLRNGTENGFGKRGKKAKQS